MLKNLLVVILTIGLPLSGQTRGIQLKEFNDTNYNLIYPYSDKTLIISQPFSYRLRQGTNVDFATSSTIVHITSNNVTLDLQGKTLSQKNTLTSSLNITGIYIADGVSNIIIKNGNINNITGTGIIVGKNCFNITLDNITIAQAQGGGIEVQSNTDTVFINNCFSGKSLSNDKHNFGLSLTANKNITINNCSFIGVRAPTGFNAFGITATNCIDCSINNCALNGSYGDTVAGMYLNNCIAFEVDNIEANGNTSNTETASGIEISGGQGNTINNSTISYNRATTHAYGIYLHNSASYNQIFDCTTFCQKASTTGDAAGLYILTGTSNCFSNITSFGNVGGSLTTSKGYGIALCHTYGAIINNSTCNYNNGGTGTGYGINLVNASKCIIEDNKLYYNHGLEGSWGIKENKNSLSFLSSNIAFGNKINYEVTHSTLNSIQDVGFKSARSIEKSNRGNVNVTT